MPKTLLIIYNKPDGRVLRSIEGGLITRRRQLLNLVSGIPLRDIAFYYEDAHTPVNPQNDRVIHTAFGHPPSLTNPAGTPVAFNNRLLEKRALIRRTSHLHILFEGGMGDQILQLEAVKALAAQEPDLLITAYIHDKYLSLIPYFSPIPHYLPHSKNPPDQIGHATVNMHTRYISDPRGGLFGKASLYGSHLGLDSVHEHVSLRIPLSFVHRSFSLIQQNTDPPRPPILTIHTRSASGHAKSWNTEHAHELARLWSRTTHGSVFLAGPPSDHSGHPPGSFTLPAAASWLDTAAVISRSSAFVGIDSGPMHLARSMLIPSVILWGGTGPGDILGRPEQSNDLRADLPCIDNVCYQCPHGNALCMRALQPAQVWKALCSLYPHALNHPSHGSTSAPALTHLRTSPTSTEHHTQV